MWPEQGGGNANEGNWETFCLFLALKRAELSDCLCNRLTVKTDVEWSAQGG